MTEGWHNMSTKDQQKDDLPLLLMILTHCLLSVSQIRIVVSSEPEAIVKSSTETERQVTFLLCPRKDLLSMESVISLSVSCS